MSSTYNAEATEEITEEELVQEVEKKEDFTDLFKNFKSIYSDVIINIDGLSKNSLTRLIKKSWGFPIKDGATGLLESNDMEARMWNNFLQLEQTRIQMLVENLRLDAEKELKEIEDAAREKIDEIKKENV